MDSNTLLAYQPDYYKNSAVMEQINNANATELNILNDRINTIKLNYNIDTANAATLTRYEKEFKLKVFPNDSLQFRRSRIKSAILGQGKFSVQMIKDIVASYPNGDTTVTLNLPFNFTIKFTSYIGIPPNLIDLQNAIEEVKPAYMRANYEFSYLLIRDVNVMKLSDLNNTVLNKFAMGGN